MHALSQLARLQRRVFPGNRVVALVNLRMSPGPVAIELFALVVAGDKRHFDARAGHVAAVKAEARIRIRPTFRKLRGVATGWRAKDSDTVDGLNRPARVDVAAEQQVDLRRLKELPESLAMRLIYGKVPVVVFVGLCQVPGGFVRLLHERPVVHHGHVIPGRG